MVFWIPIAITAVAGAIAGMGVEKGFDAVFDGNKTGTKKDIKIGGEHHEPYETYSPTITDMRQVQLPDYQVAVDSPFARQDITKKQVMEPEIDAGVTSTEGVNMTHIALIGAAGLVLYGVIKK